MGGSAQVWRALDTRTDEVVAVKRLHPIVFADPAARQRLERESRALEALVHPNVVALRDVRIEDDEAALILDYVDGMSLAERNESGAPFAVGEVVGVVRDVAAALTAAHAVGIVHRDVKPGNVILGTDGRALLTDFGIAADDTAAPTGGALTATGTIVGTFRYMAPEQLRGAPATPATDQYALAAVTYELLAGSPPYEATTPVALAEEQQRPPAPLERGRPELAAAVMRGLSTDPDDRFGDVAAFAAAVAAAVRPSSSGMETEVAAIVPAAVARADVAQAAASALPSPDPRGAIGPNARPRPRWVPAGVLAAALLAGVVVVAAMTNTGTPQDGSGGNDPSPTTPSSAPATAESAPIPTTAPGDDDGADGRDDDAGNGNGNGDGNGNGKPDKPEKPDKPDKGKGNGNGGD